MTLLDAALITLVVILLLGVVAVIARMLADADGDGVPDAPWLPWRNRSRR